MAQTASKKEASAALQNLAHLNPNWDGHGSPPINPSLISQAERILAAIETEASPVPHICPVPGGGVQLEWQHNGRELEIELLPDGSAQYLTVNGKDMDEGALGPSSVDRARRLMNWLLTGQ
jgi:hypothetical protein